MAREETINAHAQPIEQPIEENAHNYRKIAGIGIAALSLAGAAGIYALVKSDGSHHSNNAVAISANIDPKNCENPSIQIVPGTLGSESVMTAGDMSSSDAVVKTESSWFSNAPLGKHLDPGRSAVLYATTVKPAMQTKGAPVRAGVEYQAWFNDALNLIPRDPSTACRQEATLLQQDSSFGTFAKAGATVEKVVPHFGANGDISSISLVNYVVPKDGISGLLIQMGPSTKNENDYAEAAVTSSGEEYLKGVSPTPKSGGTSPNTTTTTMPHGGTAGTAEQGGTSSRANNGPSGSGTGLQVGPNGTTPENLPNGPLTGPTGTGPSAPGGPAEAAPGPGQTPGPGAGGTGGGTGGGTPNTAPPQTTPPETTPPQTTPPETTPSTAPPSTTTTTQPKGTEPTCVPNPPYVICPTN
ncbi:MAG TPA: hypothetical protein VFN56_00965 [Candidatus Saccharimonadales bacterium]|nr:hypothetical protein [Candidatus Saccharimonadales bacterium]